MVAIFGRGQQPTSHLGEPYFKNMAETQAWVKANPPPHVMSRHGYPFPHLTLHAPLSQPREVELAMYSMILSVTEKMTYPEKKT